MWPRIPYASWRDTCSALHLFTQVVGKYRLARTPWVNHSWHATLYLNGRGLTTSLVPDGPGGIEIAFDLVDHVVVGTASDGRAGRFELKPMSVATFDAKVRDLVRALGGDPRFDGRPNEIQNGIAFARDRVERAYDADAVNRYFLALVAVWRVLQRFRTAYVGKVSPVHLFWGSFDLAVTRFSGRPAPLHPGGIPALPDAVTREAYSHEVSSAGFWPGGAGVDDATFYSYAYPTPDGFARAVVSPKEARFDTSLGEFLLPYEAVRTARDPETALISFLTGTYRAAAELGGWRRDELECAVGVPLRPRPI